MSSPGVEPGLSRPQRDVLTTRRWGLDNIHEKHGLQGTIRFHHDVQHERHSAQFHWKEMSSSDRLYYSLPIRCSMPHRLLLPPQGQFIKLANNHNQTCCDIPTKSNNIARTMRQRGDLNPCGQSPMDFESITLTTRSHCHVWGSFCLSPEKNDDPFSVSMIAIIVCVQSKNHNQPSKLSCSLFSEFVISVLHDVIAHMFSRSCQCCQFPVGVLLGENCRVKATTHKPLA